MTNFPSTEQIASILAIAAVFITLIALAVPVSRAKGRMRLMGSCLIGTAFLLASLTEMIYERAFWPKVIVALAGIFLIWVGFRKYQRDPDGKTPAAKML